MNTFYTILGAGVFWISMILVLFVLILFAIEWLEANTNFFDWFTWTFRRTQLRKGYAGLGFGAIRSLLDHYEGLENPTRYQRKAIIMLRDELEIRKQDELLRKFD